MLRGTSREPVRLHGASSRTLRRSPQRRLVLTLLPMNTISTTSHAAFNSRRVAPRPPPPPHHPSSRSVLPVCVNLYGSGPLLEGRRAFARPMAGVAVGGNRSKGELELEVQVEPSILRSHRTISALLEANNDCCCKRIWFLIIRVPSNLPLRLDSHPLDVFAQP
jgi:hypothetical protein